MSPPWSPCPEPGAEQASNPPGMLWQPAASNRPQILLPPTGPISAATGDLGRVGDVISGPVSMARQPTETRRGCAGRGRTGLPGERGIDCAALTLSTSMPSTEVLHLPAAGCLGRLSAQALPPNLPLPLRQ